MAMEEEAKAEAKEERGVLMQDLRDERGRSSVSECRGQFLHVATFLLLEV